MSYKYSRYIARVTRQPWAILPEKGEAIIELMRLRAGGQKPSDEQIADALEMSAAYGQQTVGQPAGTVAVIPVHGTIAYRADSFEASSGGTSVERIGAALDRVVSDESIAGVILDFNSPGGSVDGIPELAAKIRAARAQKPIVAYVNACAASAAYWLAAQCSEIVSTESGHIGSIGVFMLLVDESEALAKAGVKINAISAGENKLEGASFLPLSDESRAHFQGQVDQKYQKFLADIAAGRSRGRSKVAVADVEKSFGQGRCFDPVTAMKVGMIDRIASFDAVASEMTGRSSGKGRMAASAPHVPFRDPETTVATMAAAADLGDYAVARPEAFVAGEAATAVAAKPKADGVEPTDGECPDGYTKGEDGLCYLMPAEEDPADDAAARAAQDEAAILVALSD